MPDGLILGSLTMELPSTARFDVHLTAGFDTHETHGVVYRGHILIYCLVLWAAG